jgi:protein-tyrosine-phosphatase
VAGKIYTALFLCTGNSARSIMAEALLNAMGRGRFRAYSAGSHPKGKVHPLAIELIEQHGLPAGNLRSKKWDESAQPGAPHMDFVFTVCDNAAGEACPVWPGRPVTAHWGIPDPAAVGGSDQEKRRASLDAFTQLRARISLLLDLPLSCLDQQSLQKRLVDIGKMRLDVLGDQPGD